jgi:hypothetical protein
MNKRTWKFRQLGVAEVMAGAESISAAARELNVNRATIHRWLQSGKISPPGGRRRVSRLEASQVPPGARTPPLPEPVSGSWGDVVRATYDFTASECELVKLAEAALVLANNETLRPSDRLNAMARFGRLLQQLNLEAPGDGEVESTPLRPWPRRVG